MEYANPASTVKVCVPVPIVKLVEDIVVYLSPNTPSAPWGPWGPWGPCGPLDPSVEVTFAKFLFILLNASRKLSPVPSLGLVPILIFPNELMF
jgi:hypothetical protein